MGKVIETVREVNNAVRSAALVGITGLIGTAGFLTYNKVTESERKLISAQSELAEAKTKVDSLQLTVAEKVAEIDKLETSLRLLKVDQRLAKIDVVDQNVDPSTEQPVTTIRFTELGPNDASLSEPREFKLRGDTIYIDNWVVKFDDKYVEQADLIRGTSLTLFRRVFGDKENPADGQSLDEIGDRPSAYARGGEPSEFEEAIWKDFWTIANDPAMAAAKGIRAIHGEAVSIKAEKGRTYRIVLRASDGLSIVADPK